MKFRFSFGAILFSSILLIVFIGFVLRQTGEIRLIVRGDDMGFSHEANVGCIEAHRNGILSVVEVMTPCDHFTEAAEMLKAYPKLDVGIHLTLNSEWVTMKWGPLTDSPGLRDEKGHFYAMVWPEPNYPKALGNADWTLDEVEKEMRAQIELALKHLPRCSHMTPHMAFHSISPSVMRLLLGLAREYRLTANLRLLPPKDISLFDDAFTLEDMIENAVTVLEGLGPGSYQTYEHPALLKSSDERPWYHPGAEDDALYRDTSTRALMSEAVKDVVKRRNIKLIGFRDLKFWQ
jgi:predicted glycoside hydrolase/deacetylase ChbG (UPF0249 family)